MGRVVYCGGGRDLTGPFFCLLTFNFFVHHVDPSFHEGNIRGGGNTVHVVILNICPAACCRRGWGRAELCLRPNPPSYFPTGSWDISFEDDVTVYSHPRCFFHASFNSMGWRELTLFVELFANRWMVEKLWIIVYLIPLQKERKELYFSF